MDNLRFYKASKSDSAILTEYRIKVLIAANELAENADMKEVQKTSYRYYQQCFDDDTHVAYLVFDGDKAIASGGISFYHVMPTYHNTSGKKSYVMNMYTAPEYRRRGIAVKVLDLLVQELKARGIAEILLEATRAGHPLYQKYGFVAMQNEMLLAM